MQRFGLRTRSSSVNGAGGENAAMGKADAKPAPAKPVTRAALGQINKGPAKAPLAVAGKAGADVKKTGYGAHGQSRLARPPLRKDDSVSTLATRGASKAAVVTKASTPEDVEMPSPAKASPAPMDDQAEITEDGSGVSARSYSSTMIPDIDEGDEEDPQMAARFAADIYVYLRHQERHFGVRHDFLQHKVVTPRMRGILVDWLHQVHNRFSLLSETMYLTVNIIDRYLEMASVGKEELQLVGVTGMLIASKYEEMYSPEINDFVYITDDTYSRKQIIATEIKMLSALGCNLGRPLPLHFLRRFSKAAGADGTLHTFAKYFMELSTCEYQLAPVLPSRLAGAALLLGSYLLEASEGAEPVLEDLWTPSLVHYSGLHFDAVRPVIRHLAKLLLKVGGEKTKLQAVRAKYSSSKLGGVAKHPALAADALKPLAE